MPGNAKPEHARVVEAEPDHTDVRDALPRIQLGTGGNERLEHARRDLEVEDGEIAPRGGEEGAGGCGWIDQRSSDDRAVRLTRLRRTRGAAPRCRASSSAALPAWRAATPRRSHV